MGNCCGSKTLHFENQDYGGIRKELLKSRNIKPLFEDDKFAATCDVLPGKDQNAEWLRPQQICDRLSVGEKVKFGEAKMGSRSRKSVNQGEIGNCWFISTLAGLVEDKNLLKKVFPPGQDFRRNYCGLFRFRFYRLGKWHEVVIDDRLPTRAGQLIYMRGGNPNEFWLALLEKAYAKFYKSYANIIGGKSMEAGVDFTGGIPQRLNVTEYIRTPGNGPEKLHHLLKLSLDNRALISCTLAGPHVQEAVDQGLKSGHAYTVTGMTKVRGGKKGRLMIPLIRLRDPHGKGTRTKWAGDWGEKSKLWKEMPDRMENKLRNLQRDGEFFMSLNKDFLHFFRDIDLIHLNPIRLELNEDRQTRKFDMAEMSGDCVKGEAGANQNIHKNPQFRFSLKNSRDKNPDCSVVVSLSQAVDNRRSDLPVIGFLLYQNCPTGNLDKKFTSNALNQCDPGTFVNSRDISQTFLLPAGLYCIIPSTFNVEDSANFYLRLFVDNRWKCDATDQEGVILPQKHVRDYTASVRAFQRCRSVWRTLLCCQCYFCCLNSTPTHPTGCLSIPCCCPTMNK